jgi:hypothetical protein
MAKTLIVDDRAALIDHSLELSSQRNPRRLLENPCRTVRELAPTQSTANPAKMRFFVFGFRHCLKEKD